MTHADLI
jgi:catalase (peroxidase I)